MKKYAEIVCVQHRDGWCATTRKIDKYADYVRTLCEHTVTYPFDIAFHDPDWVDCPECRRRLGLKEND